MFTTTNYNTYDYSDAGVWMVVASVLAIVCGILTYFLFVKSKNEPKNNFCKWLKDFLAFKIMWIEPTLKVIYYILTIYCVLASFAFISYSFITFLSMLIFAPIIIRLIYEGLMMFIMIWRNTKDISDNTKKK